MTLTWPHLNDLAAALAAAHPDVDRLELDHESLRRMVAADVDVALAARLGADELSTIKWLWMSHADDAPPHKQRAAGGG